MKHLILGGLWGALGWLLTVPLVMAGQPIRIAGATYLADAPSVIADAKGFFTQQGVDATIESHVSGKEALAGLRAGEADFALTALTPIVLDRLADSDPGGPDDPVILASLVQSSNLLQIVSLGEIGIGEPDSLMGRRIGVARGTNSEYAWWLFRRFYNLNPSSYTQVDQNAPEMFESLLKGEIDVAVLWEPWVSRLEQRLESEGRKPLHYFDLNLLYSGKWLLVTKRNTARQRLSLCRSVLAAYREAIEFMERKPVEAMRIYQEKMGVSSKSTARHWDALDYDLTLDWALIAGLQQQFLWANSEGYKNRGGPVLVLDTIDARPLFSGWPGTVGIPFSAQEEPSQ